MKLLFRLEIEKTARRNKKQIQQAKLSAKSTTPHAPTPNATPTQISPPSATPQLPQNPPPQKSPPLTPTPNMPNIAQKTPTHTTLKDYSQPSTQHVTTRFKMPDITATRFDIKSYVIHMVQNNQFSGLKHEETHAHLQSFLQ